MIAEPNATNYNHSINCSKQGEANVKLPKNYWIGIVLVLLVTTWLGARKLNADGMWFDEWWSQYVAGADTFNVPRTVDGIWNRIITENIREGAFYPMTLAAWGSLVGWTEFATRALSLFGGVIAVAGVFRLGITLSRRPMVGLGAAALMGTSLWFVTFTHEMRNYIFMVMFTVLMLLVYQRIMMQRREPLLRHFIALSVITALLIHTHFFGCLAAAVLGVWHLAQLIKGWRFSSLKRRWWGVVGAWVGSLILIIPWLINLPTAAALAASEPRVTPDINILLEVFRDTIYTFSNGSIALFALLLLFSLLAVRSLRGARWIWALTLLLIPLNLVAYYLFSLNEPRYSLATLPLLALLGGYGVYELERRRVPALAIIVVWAASFFAVENSFSVERMLQRWPGAPIREMAGVLQGRVSPTDVIIDLLGDEDRPTLVRTPLVHYLGNVAGLPNGARIEVVENSTFPGTQIFAERVRDAVGNADRVWMLNDPRWELEERGLFEYVLNEEDIYHCGTLANTSNMLVEGFGRIRSDAPSWNFGGIADISVMSAPRVTDGIMQLWLGYEVDESAPPNTYSTAVHLLNQSSQLVAQRDTGLPSAGTSCQYVEVPVNNLSEGVYRLNLAVYDWLTGDRLTATTPEGETTDYPYLFPFPVTIPGR